MALARSDSATGRSGTTAWREQEPAQRERGDRLDALDRARSAARSAGWPATARRSPMPQLPEVRVGRRGAPTAGRRRAPRATPPDPGARPPARPAARRRSAAPGAAARPGSAGSRGGPRRCRRRGDRRRGRAPVSTMPSVEIANMPPNSHDVGLRDRARRRTRSSAEQHHQRQQPGQHPGRHHPLGLRRRLQQPARRRAAGAASAAAAPPRPCHVGADRAPRTGPLPARHEFRRTAPRADRALRC